MIYDDDDDDDDECLMIYERWIYGDVWWWIFVNM